MIDNENTRKRLDLLIENNNFIFSKDIEKNSYLILYPLGNRKPQEKLRYEQVKYFSHIKINEKSYEAILFKDNINLFIAEKLFEIISNNGNDLRKNLLKLGEIFNSLYKNIDKKIIRGTFAELMAIKKYNLIPFNDSNSIYDFRDADQNDVEIKSFSPVNREIIASYQQITNNMNAKMIFIEVIESSDGESVQELFENLDTYIANRYQWIKFLDQRILNYRFKIGKVIETKSCYLSEGLAMPKKSKNAKFIFNVDDFEETTKL